MEEECVVYDIKKVCHGWIDEKGKKHPCPKHKKITDYRCADCWKKMGRDMCNNNDINDI